MSWLGCVGATAGVATVAAAIVRAIVGVAATATMITSASRLARRMLVAAGRRVVKAIGHRRTTDRSAAVSPHTSHRASGTLVKPSTHTRSSTLRQVVAAAVPRCLGLGELRPRR